MKTEILYEDRDVFVAYKPAGLAVQTARAGRQDMVSELKNYLKSGCENPEPGTPYLGVVHRLDQPVEGLLAFGKNKTAAAFLTAQLQGEGDMLCKQYCAVIYGRPAIREGELEDYLYKSAEKRAVIAEGFPESARPREARRAFLSYSIRQQSEIYDISIADIRIETGRFHQIRAQMAHAGMPLLGDQKYGSRESLEKSEALGIRNAALCACRLSFVHPSTKQKMDFRVSPRGKAFSLFSQL